MALNKPNAIVLLTGGVVTFTPEYEDAHRPSDASWVRLLYAEDLALRIGVPLLISGKGPIYGRDEAATIARFAKRLPKSQVSLENASTNTREAAQAIRLLYPQDGQVVLVSDAVHLLRATPIFERAGLNVIAAPTRFSDVRLATPTSWIPSARKLAETREALHAALGYLLGL